MGIDNIPLPGFLYQQFFGNKLVDIKVRSGPGLEKKDSGISFLGGNEKRITFIFNDSQNKFVGDAQATLLFKLLTACDLTVKDVAFVNFFHNDSITYRELVKWLQPAKVLIFGIMAHELDLPFTIPFFQTQNFGEQLYLISPSVEELQLNEEQRKQLWACLQKMFNILKQK